MFVCLNFGECFRPVPPVPSRPSLPPPSRQLWKVRSERKVKYGSGTNSLHLTLLVRVRRVRPLVATPTVRVLTPPGVASENGRGEKKVVWRKVASAAKKVGGFHSRLMERGRSVSNQTLQAGHRRSSSHRRPERPPSRGTTTSTPRNRKIEDQSGLSRNSYG